MKSKIVFSIVLFCLFASSINAQSKQPKTVRDFFMALPAEYFSLDCCLNKSQRKGKEEYLKRYLNVEDTPNGYLSGYGDAAQEGFEMALFKRPNKTYLIGFYTYGEGGIEDTPWIVFLDYKNGKFSDVSKTVIPNYSPVKNLYKLPRNGTTVEVFQKDENGEDWNKGKKLYDLIWKDGKFTIKK